MSLMVNNFIFLKGKNLKKQFVVQDKDLWTENDEVKEVSVLSTRALQSKIYGISHELLQRELGYQTVAAVVNSHLNHFAITPRDMMVTIDVTIKEVFGNHLFFSVEIYDEVEKIGSGSFERVLVSSEYLKRKVNEKKKFMVNIGKSV